MRLLLTPAPLLHLIATILLNPHPIAANPHPANSVLAGFSFNELFARWSCEGQKCGYYDQLCCSAGSACWTNAQTQAECTPTAGWSASASVSAAASGAARCHYALNETPCGDICCDGTQYCARLNHCAPAYKGQTTTTATTPVISGSAVPGIIVTSHSGTIETITRSPSTVVPYETPAATGANITMTAIHSSGGLSGGAIAGIVIGVLVGLLILGIICFYCCLKGIWDGLLALFGLGNRRRVTETDEYTRRTHYSSGGGRRTWYGTKPTSRRSSRDRRDSHLGRDLLGLGAGLAGLWAILGLKRRREERKSQEKYSEYSYSSDYYTSASSASSDDRRSERYTRQSVRRSDGRR